MHRHCDTPGFSYILVKDRFRQVSDEYLVYLQHHTLCQEKLASKKMSKIFYTSLNITGGEKTIVQEQNRMCDVKSNCKTEYSHNMRCGLCDKHSL